MIMTATTIVICIDMRPNTVAGVVLEGAAGSSGRGRESGIGIAPEGGRYNAATVKNGREPATVPGSRCPAGIPPFSVRQTGEPRSIEGRTPASLQCLPEAD